MTAADPANRLRGVSRCATFAVAHASIETRLAFLIALHRNIITTYRPGKAYALCTYYGTIVVCPVTIV